MFCDCVHSSAHVGHYSGDFQKTSVSKNKQAPTTKAEIF